MVAIFTKGRRMKIVTMNKNVSHNGKDLAKGEKLTEVSLAEIMVNMGHADVQVIDKSHAVGDAPVGEGEVESEEKSDKHHQSKGKSNR